jgi:predicted AlkP superfamily phosphohydrolase/phosphomutase
MKSSAEPRRVFCLGLDSATFDLVDPWVRAGDLPNLGRLLAEGTRAVLRSVMLPFSPQAWGTFMTGVNPGRHGVFGFKSKDPNGYAFQFVNNRSVKSRTIWNLLSELGKKVVVVNIPMTYPPEAVNGILVGGMDAPGIESRFVHPPEFRDTLFRVAEDYIIHLHIGDGYLDSDAKRRVALKGLFDMTEAREKLVLHLLEHDEWDFFVVNFSAIDQVQHHFWQFLGTDHEFRDAIRSVYRRLDDALGRIRARLPGDAAFFVLSDHGAGPTSPYLFFIDEWLREQGWLRFQSGRSLRALARNGLRLASRHLSRRLTSQLKDQLMRIFPKLRVRTQGFIRRSLIDWPATRVYSGEHPATLRINLRGRDRAGVVEPGDEYEALRDTLIARLEALEHPETGEKLIEKVYRREELYHGPWLEEAPDLVLFPPKFAHQIRGGPFLPGKNYRKIVAIKDGRQFFVSGTHQVEGLFIASGPAIVRGASVGPLDLVDLFPTILYGLGLPIPASVDGRVALEIFEPGFVERRPPQPADIDLTRDRGAPGAGNSTYSDEESRMIEESLRGMGYIE